jgi:hypothetical protein
VPKKHINNPGQPHSTTAAMVAIIPFVFASILSLLLKFDLTQYTFNKNGMQVFLHPVRAFSK